MDKFLMILCESFRPKCAEYRGRKGTWYGIVDEDYSMYSQNKLYDYIDLRAKNRGKKLLLFCASFVCGGGGREMYKRKSVRE